MKNSRFQYEYRDNASALHRAIGEVLRTSELFENYEAYQEYPVNRVNETYPDGSHHFDWVIPMLKIVVEGHGKQHYTPVAFDGDVEAAVSKFQDGKKRDQLKKAAAMAADYTYVEVPYHLEKKLDEAKFLELLEQAKKELAGFWEVEQTEAHVLWIEKVAKENQEKKLRQEEYDAKIRDEQRKKRDEFLASEKHRDDLVKQREYRSQQYRKLKETRK